MHCPVSRSYKWVATQLINQSSTSTGWPWSATRPMTCWPHKMAHDRPSHYQMNSVTKTQLTKWPLCYISAKFQATGTNASGPDVVNLHPSRWSFFLTCISVAETVGAPLAAGLDSPSPSSIWPRRPSRGCCWSSVPSFLGVVVMSTERLLWRPPIVLAHWNK